MGCAIRFRFMPLFYLHLYDDFVAKDEEGVFAVDVAAARNQAVRNARSIIAAQVMEGRLNLAHRIEIVDSNQEPVLTVPFRDAVTVEG